jgi:acyl dehydratase
MLDFESLALPPEGRPQLEDLHDPGLGPFRAPVVVNEHSILHWCETVEDGNPLYLDPEYARTAGAPDRLAPPAMAPVWFVPYRWPWPNPELPDTPKRSCNQRVKEILGLPTGIATQIEARYERDVSVGQRLQMRTRLGSISAPKRTRLGEGRFWVIEDAYETDAGDAVARQRMTVFGYAGAGSARAAPTTTPAPTLRPPVGHAAGGWHVALEEMLRGDETGYRPPPYRDRRTEVVAGGETLPALRMPITVSRCVYLASATRDYSPQHHHRDYAQQRSGVRDMFINTTFALGVLARYLTDWGGPASRVRRLTLTMRGNVCAGDDLILTGKVTGLRREAGEALVDLELMIATQDGQAMPCGGTLALVG